MNQIILDTPQDVINKIVKSENAGIYNIKIKCLGCSETNFIRYENMVVTDSKIAIGEHIFPVFIIEKVTIRYKFAGEKFEVRYKVSAKYFRTLLNEDAQKFLAEFMTELN